MAVYLTATIRCDVCPRSLPAEIQFAERILPPRPTGNAAGWKIPQSKDPLETPCLCPEHAAEYEQKRAQIRAALDEE